MDIDVYLRYLERVVPILHRWAASQPGRRVTHDRCPDDFPLLVSDCTRFRPFGDGGIRGLLSGITPQPRHRGRRPLVVRDDELLSDAPPDKRAFFGYAPHEWRPLSSQMAEEAGRIWNERHPTTGGAAHPESALYASALLDHAPDGDPMRNLYGQRDSEANYELLSGRAMAHVSAGRSTGRRIRPAARTRAGRSRSRGRPGRQCIRAASTAWSRSDCSSASAGG